MGLEYAHYVHYHMDEFIFLVDNFIDIFRNKLLLIQ